MAQVQNSIATKPARKPKFQELIKADKVQKNILDNLGNVVRTQKFTGALISAVNMNPQLQECDYISIITAGLLGETLNLSPSAQLGHYYMIPFNQKEKTDRDGNVIEPAKKVATFTMGYKGLLQLAIRSGQYRRINVIAVKEGELQSWNPLTEELKCEIIEDDEQRENAKTIGYYAYFEMINGFRKALYWSKDKMIIHADKYSQAFSKDAEDFGKGGRFHRVSFADYEAGKYDKRNDWMYSSFWYKQFDDMAFKTMLRQLISKWGIMSIELQTAYTNEGTYSDDLNEGERKYADEEVIEAETVETVEVKPEPVIQIADQNNPPAEYAEDDIPWDNMPYENSLF